MFMPEIATQTDISMYNITHEYSEKLDSMFLELQQIKKILTRDSVPEVITKEDTLCDETDSETSVEKNNEVVSLDTEDGKKVMCKYCKSTIKVKGRAKVNHKQRCKKIPSDVKKDRSAICFTDVIVLEAHKCICGTIFSTEEELKTHKKDLHNLE